MLLKSMAKKLCDYCYNSSNTVKWNRAEGMNLCNACSKMFKKQTIL